MKPLARLAQWSAAVLVAAAAAVLLGSTSAPSTSVVADSIWGLTAPADAADSDESTSTTPDEGTEAPVPSSDSDGTATVTPQDSIW